MYLVPLGIILLFSLSNIWPLIWGYMHTPPGMVFPGTIHHPSDYFYYLSQFAQHSRPFLTTINLFTTEDVPPSFVGWVNILLGKIFSLIGFSAQTAYGVSVIALTILALYSALMLAKKIHGNEKAATITLLLFSIFHAFPTRRDGTPSYHDYWNNIAVPHVRLGGVPHQLLTTLLSFITVILLLTGKPTKKHYAVMLLIGAMLASLQPVQWALIVGVSGMVYVLNKRPVILPLLLFVGGIVPALYLMRLFQTEPFIQLRLWEAAQQNNLTFTHFLLATGPVFLLSLFSIPIALVRLTPPILFSVLYSLITLILFLSPVPKLAAISHVRFFTALSVFCLSSVAAIGILKLKRYTLAALVALALLLFPVHLRSIRLANTFSPSNAYQYLRIDDYRFLTQSAGYSTDADDVFLVLWPYNTIFPGITGKRSFNGHPLLTIDAEVKDARANAFFDGTMNDADMTAFLHTYAIKYVIAYTWMKHLERIPALTYIASTDTLVLYRAQ